MTIHSTQTGHQRDIKVPLSIGTGLDVPSLGLVTISRTPGLDGLHNTYTFLHLTFQEYLAAVYLARLKEEEQMKMIILHAREKYMLMVWKFYCGMVKFENNVAQIQHIIIMSAGDGAGDISLHGVQCESQQYVVYDSIVKGSTINFSYNNCTLTPADMATIVYVISTIS